jgi:hypothetical protein
MLDRLDSLDRIDRPGLPVTNTLTYWGPNRVTKEMKYCVSMDPGRLTKQFQSYLFHVYLIYMS